MLDEWEWIYELQTPGTILGLKVRKWLVRRRTPYQQLDLALTEEYGLAFTLDGCFMLTERDEFFYHEMLVHPAMLSLESPRAVLVVGGGDGGALREVLRHPPVEEAVLAEIDPDVVEVAREHLRPVHAGSFDDPRTRIFITPGEEFVRKQDARFDVVIVDSTDPIGPGRRLFEPEFFAACRDALKPGGLLALQAGSPFHHPEELSTTVARLRELFDRVQPYLGFMPTYPAGMWAYILAGGEAVDTPQSVIESRYRARNLRTRYYTPELHFASRVLPRFVEELVSSAS